MQYSQAPVQFEFVVSTPSHNASGERSTQRLVRKHVMRPWTTRKSRPRAVVLQDEDLAEYLTQRYRRMAKFLAVQLLAEKTLGDDISGSTPPSISFGYPVIEHPESSLAIATGSPSIAAALLGAARPNPFGRYPIHMSTRELQLIHHSKSLWHILSTSLSSSAQC